MSYRRQGWGVKGNLAIPYPPKGREVKSEGKMAQWECFLCREKREPGTPDTVWSFFKQGRAESGEEKQTQKRPVAFPKHRWGFMSNMGTRLTITNRFQKTMSQFIGVVQAEFKKEKSDCLLWPRFPGSGGAKRRTPDPTHPYSASRQTQSPSIPAASKFLEWKCPEGEFLFLPLINHLFFSGKSQNCVIFHSVIWWA